MSAATMRLSNIHRRLDESITRESRALLPDTQKLVRLKKLRLSVKDRLTALMRKQAKH
jgi:uncharacterized protein